MGALNAVSLQDGLERAHSGFLVEVFMDCELQSGLHVKRHGGMSGQTMVEFALALPMLALVLFGITQYGFIVPPTLRSA